MLTRLTLFAAVATAICVTGLTLAADPSAARPFETAVFDHLEFPGPDRDRAFAHVRAAGATTVRISVPWSEIAPDGATKPANFDARDPFDPAYDFSSIDKQIVAATRAGLRPYLMIFAAPEWAERGTEGPPSARDPDPREFGHFAKAAAERYDGSTPGLPAVRYWQAWNEANLYAFLTPQFTTPFDQNVGFPYELRSPDLYRRMLVQFARAVRSVDPGNRVITGGLLPFGRTAAYRHAVWPLIFMRALLCVTRDYKPRPGCKPVPFDIWAHHPYTEGGPNHQAAVPDNASMGDLPEMRRILDAAVRAGHVDSRGPVRFWITEFSWETKPPDDNGVPMKLHARWLAEAMYRMWQQGVSLLTWFKIRDETTTRPDGYRLESGLYFNCRNRPSGCYRPKRSLTAFRFPFVAFKHGPRVRFWGRTPAGIKARVAIEQHRRNGGGWRVLRQLHTDRDGIFKGRVRRAGPGAVRARMVRPERERSLPFELKPTPDMAIPVFGEHRK